jgi:hypothetical protein
MRRSRACIAAAAAVLAVCALAASGAYAGTARAAEAPSAFGHGADHALFVQTDNPAGNQVVAYTRAADGTLTASNSYPTGGLGGVLGGSVGPRAARPLTLASAMRLSSIGLFWE